MVAKTFPDAFCVDLWTVLVDPEPISGPRSYKAAKEAFLQACSTSGEPCTMAIGFVLAWISGEGLHPPSLPLFESRLPKGHQQAQRSDMVIRRETLPTGGRGGEVRSARESCSAAPATRSQPCVRRPQRCACALLLRVAPLKAATCCSLLQSCGAAAVLRERSPMDKCDFWQH